MDDQGPVYPKPENIVRGRENKRKKAAKTRSGPGRPVSPLKARSVEVALEAASQGITPAEFLLNVMRSEPPEQGNDEPDYKYAERIERHTDRRIDAAKAVAPFIHPKLASVEHKGEVAMTHEVALSELE